MKKGSKTWRPPTRRTFVTMIAAAAASLAVRPKVRAEPAPEPRKKPIWIGHV